MQQELLLAQAWLEPMADGCLVNVAIRTSILKLLDGLPLDMGDGGRREQMKRSGLGPVRCQHVLPFAALEQLLLHTLAYVSAQPVAPCCQLWVAAAARRTDRACAQVVMFLKRVSDETPTNRRLAGALIRKWARQVVAEMRDDDDEAVEAERERQLKHIRRVRPA